MWRVLASVGAVVVLVMGTVQVVGLLAHAERTTVATYDATGLSTLDVRVEDGTLTVVGTDAETITVTAHVSDGLFESDEEQRVVDDRLELRGRCPGPPAGSFRLFCDVAYTVELPARMAVVARVESDAIRLEGVEGDVDARSREGGIRVRGSGGGTLRLRTEHGSIDALDLRAATVEASSDHGSVSLDFADPPGAVSARSQHGDVAVAVPDDGTDYAVDVPSGTVPIRTDPSSDRTIAARTEHGSVLVTYRTR